jgi:hypothetical protein
MAFVGRVADTLGAQARIAAVQACDAFIEPHRDRCPWATRAQHPTIDHLAKMARAATEDSPGGQWRLCVVTDDNGGVGPLRGVIVFSRAARTVVGVTGRLVVAFWVRRGQRGDRKPVATAFFNALVALDGADPPPIARPPIELRNDARWDAYLADLLADTDGLSDAIDAQTGVVTKFNWA